MAILDESTRRSRRVGAIAPTLPREVLPGVHWLATCVEMPEKGIHGHNCAYVLIGSRATAIVDTGAPRDWPRVYAQVQQALGGRDLDYIFPTHPEYPHFGNMASLLRAYPGARAVGDVRDFTLFYPDLADRFDTLEPGVRLDLGGRSLVLVPAFIRDLANTLWAYDAEDRILFTSDGYSYSHQHNAGECASISTEATPATAESVAVLIRTVLHWSQHTDVSDHFEQLNGFLVEHPVDYVAGTHAAWIVDPSLLHRLLREGLEASRRAAAERNAGVRLSPEPATIPSSPFSAPAPRLVRLDRSGRVEEIADRVFALSQLVSLRQRVSWVARDVVAGVDPASVHLILGQHEALLVDTGYAAHERGLLDQLGRLLPSGMPLRIVITGTEPYCVGNLPAIMECFNVVHVESPSPLHPLAFFSPLPEPSPPFHAPRAGDVLTLDGEDRFDVLLPAIYAIPTIWLFDRETGVLFTSDCFTHARVDASWAALPEMTPAELQAHLLARFDWLASADTTVPVARLDEIFGSLPISTLAPEHGQWIVGPEAVARAYRATRQTALAMGVQSRSRAHAA